MPAHSKPAGALILSRRWRAILGAAALVLLTGALRSSPRALEVGLPSAIDLQAGCNGRCLNPHPGQPKESNGQVAGCRVQVLRRWPDGCVQSQWRECNGALEAPKGVPKVTWICCVH
jgi:hypothetical protein